MCGISGLVDPRMAPETRATVVAAMNERVARRGPDGHGCWIDPTGAVALGHRRLAVVDLSPTGDQPMRSPSGRFVGVVNGEIYDHRRVRAHLESVVFRGTSDTEVLLAAVDRWGPREALKRVNGMFAVALWDTASHELWLARDRLGEKPLYYAATARSLRFASSLDALRAGSAEHGAVAPDLDDHAVASYFRYGFVPHPRTILAGARQLGPGEALRVRVVDGGVSPVEIDRWWSLEQEVVAAIEERAAPPPLESLHELLVDAVSLRLQADVPTGTFLSGGIDSSLVTAIAASVRPGLKTFTVAVGTSALDESARAATVARHLRTDHTTIELGDGEAAAAVAAAVDAYDEPFADPSAVPSLLLCREVRRHVTVALGGDGGDELFAGYNRHAVGAPAWDRASRLPVGMARRAGALLSRAPATPVDRAAGMAGRLVRREPPPHLADKLAKLGMLLGADRGGEAWDVLAGVWPTPPLSTVTRWDRPAVPAALSSTLDRLRWSDTAVTLADEMLVKVDRASMYWALEVRAPLLDHRLLGWAWAQPSERLVRRGVGKQPLRELLERYVPAQLVAGPKRGFDPPLAEWLRGPLRSWAQDRLEPDRLAATGWIDPGPVATAWREHQDRAANHDYRLWAVLSFVGWLERGRGTGGLGSVA